MALSGRRRWHFLFALWQHRHPSETRRNWVRWMISLQKHVHFEVRREHVHGLDQLFGSRLDWFMALESIQLLSCLPRNFNRFGCVVIWSFETSLHWRASWQRLPAWFSLGRLNASDFWTEWVGLRDHDLRIGTLGYSKWLNICLWGCDLSLWLFFNYSCEHENKVGKRKVWAQVLIFYSGRLQVDLTRLKETKNMILHLLDAVTVKQLNIFRDEAQIIDLLESLLWV